MTWLWFLSMFACIVGCLLAVPLRPHARAARAPLRSLYVSALGAQLAAVFFYAHLPYLSMSMEDFHPSQPTRLTRKCSHLMFIHSLQIVGWGVVPLLVPLLRTPPPSSLSHPPSLSPSLPHPPTTLPLLPAAASINTAMQAASTAMQAASTGMQGASTAAMQAGSTSKTKTYVLATLLLLAMHEPRHADVVCRCGAIPALIALIGTADSNSTAVSGNRNKNGSETAGGLAVREYSAAVLSCLSRMVDAQV